MRVPLFKGDGFISKIVRWINTTASVSYMKGNAPEKFHDMIILITKLDVKINFDYNYIPSLNDPRVDIKNQGIDRVVENGILLKNGEHIEADIIVACTGYNLSKSYFNFEIVGRNGANISEEWKKDGPSAYRTLLVKQSPNLWTIGVPIQLLDMHLLSWQLRMVLIISSRLPNQSLKEKLNQLELPTKLTTTGLQLFKKN